MREKKEEEGEEEDDDDMDYGSVILHSVTWKGGIKTRKARVHMKQDISYFVLEAQRSPEGHSASLENHF